MDWGWWELVWVSLVYWTGVAMGFIAGTDIERKRGRGR